MIKSYIIYSPHPVLLFLNEYISNPFNFQFQTPEISKPYYFLNFKYIEESWDQKAWQLFFPQVNHTVIISVYILGKGCFCEQFFSNKPFQKHEIHMSTEASNNNISGQCQVPQVEGWLTSTGVDSDISRNITMHRFWFGLTFSPFSSTWTKGKAVKRKKIIKTHTLHDTPTVCECSSEKPVHMANY